MAVNIFGVMVGSQRAARHMAEQRRRRHRQHHVDRRDQRRRGRDGVPRDEGRGHPLHPVDRGRAGPARHPGELHRARAHPDRDQREPGPVVDRARDAAAPARRIAARRRRGRRSTSRATGPRRSPASCCPVDGGTTAGSPPRSIKDLKAAPATGLEMNGSSSTSRLLLRRPPRSLRRAAEALGVAAAERAGRARPARGRRATATSVWVCEDAVIGRSGRSPKSKVAKNFSAIGRAGIDDDGYRAGNPKLRLEDMDRDGLAASVIYGPLVARLPDRRSRVAERVLRGVERLGGRGVQRGRARPAVRARVPARVIRPRPPRPSSNALRALGHRGAIIGVFDIDARRPRVGPAVGRGRSRPGCRSASTSRAARRRS